MKAAMVEPKPDTESLVEKARRGDREAFDALAERYRPRLEDSIRSWARFRIGAPLEVEEIVQETFIRALRSLEKFEWQEGDAFFRWLCGIAKRAVAQAALDARRESLRRAGSASSGGLPASGPTPSQALRRDERFARLEQSLEKLRPEHREVVLLSRIEGLTIKEIAARMKRSPSTIKYFLACALRDLKGHFGDTESLPLPDRQLHVDGHPKGEEQPKMKGTEDAE